MHGGRKCVLRNFHVWCSRKIVPHGGVGHYCTVFNCCTIAVSQPASLPRCTNNTFRNVIARRREACILYVCHAGAPTEEVVHIEWADARFRYLGNQSQVKHVVDWLTLVLMLMLQATKASAAQSRVKMLQKMEANATPLPEGKSTFRAKMKLPPPPACHTKQASVT